MKIKSKKKIHHFLVGGILCTALSFFLIHQVMIKSPGFLERSASYILYPVFVLDSFLVEPFRKRSIRNQEYATLKKNYLELQKNHENLSGELVALKSMKQFSDKTDALVKFEKRYDTQFMELAQVIGRTINSNEHTCLINRGSQHGIAEGMAVVYKKRIVGKVLYVYPYYSKVILVTDSRCTVSGSCYKTGTKGIYQGINETESALMTHVDVLKKIEVGDQVISTGQGLVFPEGFLLGTIKSSHPEGMHHSITIVPAVDVHDIEYCYVVQKSCEASVQEST